LIDAIKAQTWKMRPLITRVRGAIHTRSIELLKNLQIPMALIKKQGYVVSVAPKWTPKRHWTTCPKYSNHSRFKSIM
jgi:hypothetical protein